MTYGFVAVKWNQIAIYLPRNLRDTPNGHPIATWRRLGLSLNGSLNEVRRLAICRPVCHDAHERNAHRWRKRTAGRSRDSSRAKIKVRRPETVRLATE